MPTDNGMSRITSPDTLIPQIPGVIFQLYRSRYGQMHFPYLEGGGDALQFIDRQQLAADANGAIEHLTGSDYPQVMSAIERSARWKLPLSVRFRLPFPKGRPHWVAVSATPHAAPDGVHWSGIMMDITNQVLEEERLRKLCDTDPLTGLANRRKLIGHLTRLAALSTRHYTPMSILMIDIDHFKKINDRWGHLYGDSVLKQLAGLTQAVLRSDDMIARLGGEEFMAVLPLTPLSPSLNLADRLRSTIASHDFGNGAGAVTLSIGVAEYRFGESLTCFMERADQALYSAKDTGRDCVCPLS